MATKQLGAPASSGKDAHTVSSVSPASAGRWWWRGAYQSGYWYLACGHISNSGANFWTNNRVQYIPFTVWDTLTITAVNQRVIAAGDPDALLRVGFYSHNASTGTPDSLIFSPGNFSAGTNSAGATTFSSTTSMTIELAQPFTFQPGVYWCAGVVTNSPTTRAQINCAAVHPLWNQPISGSAAAIFTSGGTWGWFQDGITDLPQSAAAINPTSANTQITQLGLRLFMRAQ